MIHRSRNPRNRDRRAAAAAVEMAIILPVLMTLVLGAVDFGRVLALSVELANAARLGADMGATNIPSTLNYSTWLSRVNTVVTNDLTATQDFNMNNVAISVNLGTDAQNNQQVQVTITYQFTTIVNWPYIPNSVPLHAQMVMVQYR